MEFVMSTIKKPISIILSVLLLLSVLVVAPITANAEVSKSGTVGDCQYEFNSSTGHLRIFGGTTIEEDGNGKMPWATDGPASFNSLSVKSVTIEDGIKTIGNGAFYWCKNLTSVTIPNNLTYIGKSA
ncbi:MAG: leucine-rich repeat protein [Ruminococcus sp.]|nr:leucine-rich repeat protein [Ruminococcus sp.]